MLTVEKFVAGLDPIQVRCVAGFRGVTRELLGFSIIDTPEILDWLQGGEFVVDSGYITKNNSMLLNSLIPALKARGCAALGVKLHRYHETIPDVLIEQGNLYDFPVYELPFGLCFSDFTFLVHKRLFEDRMDIKNKVAWVYQMLVDSLCKYRLPERLLYDLSLMIDNPILLVNHQFELIGFEESSGLDVDLEDFFVLKPDVPVIDTTQQEILQRLYRNTKFQLHQFAVQSTDGALRNLNCVLLPVEQMESGANFLIIPEVIPMESWHYQTLKNIASLFSMAFYNLQAPQNKSVPDFFSLVLMDPDASKSAILKQCKVYEFDYTKKRVCLTLQLSSYRYLSVNRKRVIQDIIQSVTSWASDTYGLKVYSLQHSNYQILFLLFSNSVSPKTAEAQSLEVAEKLVTTLNECSIDCQTGISLCYTELCQIAKAFQQTIDAIDLGNKLFPSEKLHSFNALQIYHWLMSTMTRDELKEIYQTTVKPLRERHLHGTNYIQILETFICNRFNISKTASDMYTHRNTMTNYLNQIQNLLSLDITEPQDMLKVQIGLHAMRLLDVLG